jgi:ParB-like chromosome segregation protein Spo0J
MIAISVGRHINIEKQSEEFLAQARAAEQSLKDQFRLHRDATGKSDRPGYSKVSDNDKVEQIDSDRLDREPNLS